MKLKIISSLALALMISAFAIKPSKTKLQTEVETLAEDVEAKVIEWRHHLHEHPELSNREFKTAEYITAHLKSLGLEVQPEWQKQA